MALGSIGRRFGDWLGIEPEAADGPAAPPAAVAPARAPGGRVLADSPAFARDLAELHELISDLRSGVEVPPT